MIFASARCRSIDVRRQRAAGLIAIDRGQTATEELAF
jgi:hypothetical protein